MLASSKVHAHTADMDRTVCCPYAKARGGFQGPHAIDGEQAEAAKAFIATIDVSDESNRGVPRLRLGLPALSGLTGIFNDLGPTLGQFLLVWRFDFSGCDSANDIGPNRFVEVFARRLPRTVDV
jgi:hypothetical protein